MEKRLTVGIRQVAEAAGVSKSTASRALSREDRVSPETIAHVEKVAPRGVTVKVTYLHGGRPWRAELKGPLYEAARRALATAFEKEPVIVGEGGSIPVVGDFERVLGVPVLLVGFGLPGENAHAPNEWMSEENFRIGMRAMAVFLDEYAKSERH